MTEHISLTLFGKMLRPPRKATNVKTVNEGLQKGKLFQKMAKKIYFGERLYEN